MGCFHRNPIKGTQSLHTVAKLPFMFKMHSFKKVPMIQKDSEILKVVQVYILTKCIGVVCISPITFLCKFSDIVLSSFFFISRRCQDQMEICHQATADLQFFACQSLYGSNSLWRQCGFAGWKQRLLLW